MSENQLFSVMIGQQREALHAALEARSALEKRLERLEERLERLEVALHRIADWGAAYPEDAFPPPGEDYYRKAHQILTAHTLTLDRIAADCMRHAVHGCAVIAREALDGPTQG